MIRIPVFFLFALSLCAQTASFPAALPTDADLLEAKDRAETTLVSSISAGAVSLSVNSGARFGANMIITLEAEQIKICSVVSNVLYVCAGGRGWNGTSAVPHGAGVSVRGQVSAWYHNRLSKEIQAIANSLGENLAHVIKNESGHVTYNPSDDQGRKIFAIGAAVPNYRFHFEDTDGSAVEYLPLDTSSMFARAHSSNLSAYNRTQQVLSVQQDAHYATGTPWALSVFQSTKVRDSAGSAGILSRVKKLAESTDISFALHGECFSYTAEGGTCVGANTELTQLVDSPTALIGYVGQVGLESPVTQHSVLGMRLNLAHPTTNSQGGAHIIANKGTHAFGLRIEEFPSDGGGWYTGGTFTKSLQLHTRKNAPNIFEMVNNNPALSASKNQILFSRSPADEHQVAMIESDTEGPTDFSVGYIDIYTSNFGLKKAVRFDGAGSIRIERGHIRQSTSSVPASSVMEILQYGFVKVTDGTGPITLLSGCSSDYTGRELTLQFETTVAMHDGAGMNLAGNLNATPGTMWRAICDGNAWMETSRSAN